MLVDLRLHPCLGEVVVHLCLLELEEILRDLQVQELDPVLLWQKVEKI